MRETISTITTNNNIEYVISVEDNYNLKYYRIEGSVCYITRIDNNKFFAKRNTIQFSYSDTLDHYKVKDELKKKYGSQHRFSYFCTEPDYNKARKELEKKYGSQNGLPYKEFIYFSQIVDNMITCLKAQSDLVFDLMKDFDKSTWEEKAMIVYQLYDSAEKIKKYEEKQYLLNNSAVLNKVNTLQSITDSLEEL